MASWQIEEQSGLLSFKSFAIRVHSDQGPPMASLSVGGEWKADLFRILRPELGAPTFRFRHPDWIAQCSETESGPFSAEVRWRLIPTQPDQLGLEWIFSLRTEQLETSPRPEVEFSFAGKPIPFELTAFPGELQLLPSATGRKSSQNFFSVDSGHSGGLLVGAYPGDLQSLEQGMRDGNSILRYRMQAESLEKGVVRRVRMWLIAAAGDDWLSTCRELAEGAFRRPVPLDF